ncbi:MAG: hypothetical protein AAFY21_11285, partial [Cyanobacteria bacterium J06641_2]
MSMLKLLGLKELIESISRERNLPRLAVQSAIREALLKGYERYRLILSINSFKPSNLSIDIHR